MDYINDKMKADILKMMTSAAPELPSALSDDRSEPAFKESADNEEGYSECLPVVWTAESCDKLPNGILIINIESAVAASQLYSKYLDEEALVWDAAGNELYLYRPQENSPKLAFKGGRWMWSGKLKAEYAGQNLEEIYLEIAAKLQEERG